MDDRYSSFMRTSRLLFEVRLWQHARAVWILVFLFGGWLSWLFLGSVSVYASSVRARLESQRFPFPIEAPTNGVAVVCNLNLGESVQRGDVLVQLDTRAFEHQRDELVAQLNADQVGIDALSQQLEAAEAARNTASLVVSEAKRAGDARLAASHTAARYKTEESDIVERLHDNRLSSDLDALRTKGEAEATLGQAKALVAQTTLDVGSSMLSVKDRDAQVATLRAALANAHALTEVHKAQKESAEYEIDRRILRAQAAGTLVDIAPCTAGMSVQTSQRLATLLTDSQIRVVSFFRPEDAVGRVQRGQRAVLRIDNFPWTQYGTLAGVVQRVGNEPREGLVRVELNITGSNAMIPVVHGLTGTCEVEVERTSPWHLLLRLAGHVLSASAAPPPGQAQAHDQVSAR